MIEQDVVAAFIEQISAPLPTRLNGDSSRVIDKLPPHPGYPEAIRDGDELDFLVRYFLPQMRHDIRVHGESLLHALYNPQTISALATELGLRCPPGYSAREMIARAATTDPCLWCRAPVLRHTSALTPLCDACRLDVQDK